MGSFAPAVSQRLKPGALLGLGGTTEVVPFPFFGL